MAGNKLTIWCLVVTRPTRGKVAKKYTRNESEMKGDENQSEIRKAPPNLTQPENSNHWQKVQGYQKI